MVERHPDILGDRTLSDFDEAFAAAPGTGEVQSSPATLPDLDEYFSFGEAAFAYLLERLAERPPATLLEFGSGGSTVRLALALPDTQIFSVEHNATYAARTRELLAAHGINNVSLFEAPIRRQRHGLAVYSGYDLQRVELPGRIDVALIDGPPGEFLGGREAVLYAIAARLAPDALVVLDDLFRHHEQRALAHWQHAFPDTFTLSYSDIGHQQAYLQFRQTPLQAANAAAIAAGHLKAHLGRWYHKGRRALGLSKGGTGA